MTESPDDESAEPAEPPSAEISEDIFPNEAPVTSLEQANIELRRWVVLGLGSLITLAMFLGFIAVLVRPSLADFTKDFLQLVIGGLIGLAGSAIGFLFGQGQR